MDTTEEHTWGASNPCILMQQSSKTATMCVYSRYKYKREKEKKKWSCDIEKQLIQFMKLSQVKLFRIWWKPQDLVKWLKVYIDTCDRYFHFLDNSILDFLRLIIFALLFDTFYDCYRMGSYLLEERTAVSLHGTQKVAKLHFALRVLIRLVWKALLFWLQRMVVLMLMTPI